MLRKLFGFIWKKRVQKASLMSADSWSLIDVIEYQDLPIKGSLIYLAERNQYYEVVHVIHYADFDFKVLRKYLIVQQVPNELVRPTDKKS